jgi:hypothetical protein
MPRREAVKVMLGSEVMLLAVLLALPLLDAPVLDAPVYVKVSASYLAPPSAGADAAVAVQLTPVDPHIRVNEDPAPRLKLDTAQQVLEEKAAARRKAAAPGEIRYLDPTLPVTFPVKVNARAARGEHTVKATVTYFYCSKSEGWCRKGSADVDVPVRIP